MNYKISAIIPVYNAEKHLQNTIESVINQSIGFNNIELILIDDLSTDSSRKIIEKYCENYKNIIPFYSEKNHGSPGFGRNKGLKIATSDYIMFLDNDDEYDKEICKKLYKTIITESADIACCNKISVDAISKVKHPIYYKNGIEKNGLIIVTDDDMLNFDSVAVWSKIYKKNIIKKNNIKFKENTRADDFAFTIEYYLNSKKLIYLKDYHGYLWNIQSDSLSHTITKNHFDELLTTYRYVYNKLKDKNKEEYMDFLIKSHIMYLITQCTYFDLNGTEIKVVIEDIYDFEKEISFNDKLDDLWVEVVNKFILKKQFKIAISLLKIVI